MEVSPFLALLPIALLSLPVLLFFFSTGRKTSPPHVDGRSLPPSPPGLPLLGHLPLLGSLPHRKLRAMAGMHGPVMLLRFGSVPTVVVSSGAAAQEAMKTRDPSFAGRFRSRVVERLFYGRDMAFADYGEHWRQARRVCVFHLLSQRRVLSFRRLREREVAALVDRIRGGAAAAVNLSELLISYAKDVIVHAALGGDYGFVGGGKVRKVFSDLGELMDSGTVGELVPWLAWVDSVRGLDAKVTRTIEMLDGLLEHAIADHRERRRVGRKWMGGDDEDDQRDFVDALLDASEEEEAGELWFDTVATIKAIILDMFIAATDTTYTTLEWAMAELINHPDKMRRLQDEIRAAVGNEDHVTEDHLNTLRFLKSVIKETLRLHPPVPLVPRETIEDTELLGYHIPAGTHVLVNIWTIGRDPKIWERAEEFLPERFAEDATMDQYMLGHDFTLLPFGAGRRGCPGVGFSMTSVELVLASLLYHFDWELPNGASRIEMDEHGGLAVRLKKTLHLIAKPWSTLEMTMCPKL